MLGVRVSKLRYLEQLSIAQNPGLLGVRVPKLRYLEQLSIAQNPGLLGVLDAEYAIRMEAMLQSRLH